MDTLKIGAYQELKLVKAKIGYLPTVQKAIPVMIDKDGNMRAIIQLPEKTVKYMFKFSTVLLKFESLKPLTPPSPPPPPPQPLPLPPPPKPQRYQKLLYDNVAETMKTSKKKRISSTKKCSKLCNDEFLKKLEECLGTRH